MFVFPLKLRKNTILTRKSGKTRKTPLFLVPYISSVNEQKRAFFRPKTRWYIGWKIMKKRDLGTSCTFFFKILSFFTGSKSLFFLFRLRNAHSVSSSLCSLVYNINARADASLLVLCVTNPSWAPCIHRLPMYVSFNKHDAGKIRKKK